MEREKFHEKTQTQTILLSTRFEYVEREKYVERERLRERVKTQTQNQNTYFSLKVGVCGERKVRGERGL